MKKKIIAVLISIAIIACLSAGLALHINNQIQPVNLTEQNGLSAYELAVTYGYEGTVQEWLDSLSDKSSYEIAKDNSFNGNETEWLDSVEEKSKQETIGIKTAEISSHGDFIITLTDNTEINLGKTAGTDKDIIVNNVSVSASNELIITTSDSKKYNLGIIKGDKHVSDNNGETVTNAEVSDDGSLIVTFGNGNKDASVTDSTKTPSIYVDSVTASAGDIVELPISIFNNPGINGAQFDVSYDSKLELKNAQNGKALSSLNFTAPGVYSNPSKFLWDGISENEKGNGVALTLSFSVPSDAKPGDKYSVSVSYPKGAIYDSNLNDVKFDTVNGSITIK